MEANRRYSESERKDTLKHAECSSMAVEEKAAVSRTEDRMLLEVKTPREAGK